MRFSFLPVLLLVLILASCEWVTEEPAKGKIHYVIVGQNYNWDRKEGNHLRFCINDAYAMKQTIEHYYPDSAEDALSAFIIDETPEGYQETYGRFREAIDTLSHGNSFTGPALANDTTFICYSGHGVKSGGEGEDGAYVLLANYTGAANYSTENLTPSELLDEVREIPGEVVIISDSCYSGAIAGWYGNTADVNVFGSSAWEAAFSSARYPTTSIHILCASTPYQTAKEKEGSRNHGEFTYAFIRGCGATEETASQEDTGNTPLKFSGAPAALRGKVSLDSLFSFVRKETQGLKQDVTSAGNPDDIVLFSL